MANKDFFKGMKLTPEEIRTFEKYIDVIEDASKGGVNFLRSPEVLAWTPGALLVVAVAKFVYDVYQDYGVIDQTQDLQIAMNNMIDDLNALEKSGGKDAPNLKSFAKVRKEVFDQVRRDLK